ncbi:MAG: Lrp/AsnC ligand binding domain-containing protein [Thermoplasmata archaeon]|nr:MAG: Lrp/AsnC ligand binding domain-containing protein [Thermoplasmata archaeon]
MTPALSTENIRPRIVAPPPWFEPSDSSVNFVLVKLVPGTVEKTKRAFKKIHGITGIHPVFGEYDLVLIIRQREKVDRDKLIRRIRRVSSVLDIQTLLAAS